MSTPQERLEELRARINAENISYSELAELQELAPHIDPGDVQLLEWAGIPETQEHLTYWQHELSNVITAGDAPRIKITGAINGTKWLNLTASQFEKLETFLLTIEETD